MAIRSIRRQSSNPGAYSGTTNAAPIYVDSDTNTAKYIPAGSGTTEVEIADVSATQTFTNKTLTSPTITSPTISSPTITDPVVTGPAPVNATAATLAVTAAAHAGRTVTLNRAAGIAVTLPAATGTGNKYRFVVGTTFTGAATIKVASATDYMIGTATLFADLGDTVVGFATANTGTVGTESDTIDLLGTANSTGGIKGAIVEIEDIATAVFAVWYVSDAGGTEATPFSATVA